MKVYHYTFPNNWESIKNGSWQSNNKPGVGLTRRLGKIHDEAWNTGAAFALLEPTPQNWTHNSEFPGIWSRLKENMGNMLLEIEVEEEDQGIFVIDRREIEKFLYANGTGKTVEEMSEERRLAEGKYIGSKIPIFEYIKHKEKYPFALPEVIFTNNIPIEKITISQEQPLLPELIEGWKEGSEYQKRVIREITSIPELKAWYVSKYLPKKGTRQNTY